MATFNYARSRATAERLLERFGQAGMIRRRTPGVGGDPWNPTGDTTTDHPCVVVLVDYSERDRANQQIGASDKNALISTEGLTIVPGSRDELVVAGEAHAIQRISPLSPGGTTILYDAQVTT